MRTSIKYEVEAFGGGAFLYGLTNEIYGLTPVRGLVHFEMKIGHGREEYRGHRFAQLALVIDDQHVHFVCHGQDSLRLKRQCETNLCTFSDFTFQEDFAAV